MAYGREDPVDNALYSSPMTPTADYSCRGKCKTPDLGAPVYELPINSVRCPKCGSKKIERLYNQIGVLRGAQPDRDPRLTNSSHLVRSGALLRSGFDYAAQYTPGYTPPGGGIEDRARYDKLKTFEVAATDIPGLILPGKGQPMTELEIARDRRSRPGEAVDMLARLSGRRVPTYSDPSEKPSRSG
jgi:hypothetical protein